MGVFVKPLDYLAKVIRYAVYHDLILYPVTICECGNKKVADPRGKHVEQILQQKWYPNCRRRGH
jgi:hypothetical protein